MFVWVGIDVDSQLKEIKEITKVIENELIFKHSNFTLPLHISLKISFEINDEIFQNVIDDIIKIYTEIPPFEIRTKELSYENNISWILMEENPILIDLSNKINHLMLTKYDVPLHEYDLDYKFHTTLFMDENSEKVKQAYNKIQHIKLPVSLKAERFLIGLSESGKLGTYRVYQSVDK
jgi:2'-5' RNA ligase